MKLNITPKNNNALTITEVLVVVATLCLLAAVVLADVNDPHARAQKINCVNNLKQIGLAYRIWAGDNNDKYPAAVPARLGGARESALAGDVAAIFLVMSNELSTPKILICPADTTHKPATRFTADFDKSHVSYFAGVDAAENHPSRWLSGDSNLSVDGTPAPSGLLKLSSSSTVAWTAERHVNQGNLGLADGSVQQTTAAGMQKFLSQSGLPIQRLVLP